MPPIEKTPSGNRGLDEVTGGGFPVGRVTLISGSAGAGKTVLAMETLYRGAHELGEKGVFVAFEESPDQLETNAASFEWHRREQSPGVAFIHARLSESILQEGDFDLNGLLAVVGAKVDEIGAKRVVFDGLDVFLGNLADERAAKREITRIREWIVGRNLCGLITAKDDGTQQGAPSFLQFAVDAVVELRHEQAQGTFFRTLRVSKYRGSDHSTDEFGYSLSPRGLSVSTRGSAEMVHDTSDERLSTGVESLDGLVGGGYFRGTAILLSGAPGTAKTTFGGAFLEAACARGENALFVSFDEGAAQIRRNLRSVNVELESHVAAGKLRMRSYRTRSANLQRHIQRIVREIDEHEAKAVVVDPISSFQSLERLHDAGDAATYLIDACKSRGVTVLVTSLVNDPRRLRDKAPIGLSSIADVWIHLAYRQHAGERNRTLSVVKARGTAHTNQVRELFIDDEGIHMTEVYTAGGEVLLGTLRWEREARASAQREQRRRERARLRADAARKMEDLQRRMQTMEDERLALVATMDELDAHDGDEASEHSFEDAVRRVRRGRKSEE